MSWEKALRPTEKHALVVFAHGEHEISISRACLYQYVQSPLCCPGVCLGMHSIPATGLLCNDHWASDFCIASFGARCLYSQGAQGHTQGSLGYTTTGRAYLCFTAYGPLPALHFKEHFQIIASQ